MAVPVQVLVRSEHIDFDAYAAIIVSNADIIYFKLQVAAVFSHEVISVFLAKGEAFDEKFVGDALTVRPFQTESACGVKVIPHPGKDLSETELLVFLFITFDSG